MHGSSLQHSIITTIPTHVCELKKKMHSSKSIDNSLFALLFLAGNHDHRLFFAHCIRYLGNSTLKSHRWVGENAYSYHDCHGYLLWQYVTQKNSIYIIIIYTPHAVSSTKTCYSEYLCLKPPRIYYYHAHVILNKYIHA